MNILVTGGAGYIGSHTLIELSKAGHRAVVVDNLANSSQESLRRVEAITGQQFPFYRIDCANHQALSEVFEKHAFDAVIHFAGLKAVGESVAQPLHYYSVNIGTTLNLCRVMREHQVHRLIFSSSATVYGNPAELPLKETSRTGNGITNPYGQTKFMIEQILRDLVKADPNSNITLLRYFNPVGAHESGQIGEDPNGLPNNLLPYVSQVAVGKLPQLHVHGNDYDTPDGTGVRDYIHVVDLARGHVAALEKMDELAQPETVQTYNLGTSRGVSVLEIVKAFEQASGKSIPYEIGPRRPGDVASCYADASKAERDLGWKAEKSIEDACRDAWRWQSQNPDGFA